AFVNVGTGEAPTPSELGGSVKLLYDQQALYLGFEVFDDDLRGGFGPSEPDPHLWLKDTVEVMIDPDGDGDNRDYYEIQVNPQGLVFDSQFDSYNQPRVLPEGPFGHQDFDSGLLRAVTILGSIDDDTDIDRGYLVELALPFSRLSKARRVPPPPGAEWRANFYVMQDNGGVSWSPILGQGNFHRASRFGRLRFR
ncbi:MAG TPA: carbohydrate-binding family 9-like protein, partial [Polyangiaceae bacterium]